MDIETIQLELPKLKNKLSELEIQKKYLDFKIITSAYVGKDATAVYNKIKQDIIKVKEGIKVIEKELEKVYKGAIQ